MAACFAYLTDSAHAEDGSWTSDFYSYLPAAPSIKAPDLDFIPFWTDDLKKAKRAYKNGEFDRARKFFQKASEDGNIVADWYLGHMYRLGRGVPRDDAKAFSYFSRVADAFDPEDQPVLERVSTSLEGKTARQKNPHPRNSLAFAAWVIARLGGWTGYYGKPGPVVMLHGLVQFHAIKHGWTLHNV